MKNEPARSGFRWIDAQEADADAVLRRLLREAAEVVPGLSSDPSLSDPLVRLLLAGVSREYSRLYGRLDGVIDQTFHRLVENLLSYPRAARPSSAVFHLQVKDPDIGVDELLEVVGRKAVGGADGHEERSIHFLPLRQETVSGVPSPVVVLDGGQRQAWLVAPGGMNPRDPVPAPREWATEREGTPLVHLGFDLPSDMIEGVLPLYLLGNERAVAELVWSTWCAGDDAAPVGEPFVPGRQSRKNPWHQEEEPSVFRSRTDNRRPASIYDRNFVDLDVARVIAGRGAVPGAVNDAVTMGVLPSVPARCWLTLRMGHEANLDHVRSMRLVTNCVVAFNVNRVSAGYSLGVEPVQEVELPVGFADLFKIYEVYDSTNSVHFVDAEQAAGVQATEKFHLATAPNGQAQVRLWSKKAAMRPRRVEIAFATTYGHAADGLDPGSIDVIYDGSLCPGVAAAVNITPSAGGASAGHQEHHADELRALLASRGRAVTAHDYRELSRAFDPGRIAGVEVGRGVARVDRGVTTCVQVNVDCHDNAFTGRLEREEFQRALLGYLRDRAPAGQAIVVNLREA